MQVRWRGDVVRGTGCGRWWDRWDQRGWRVRQDLLQYLQLSGYGHNRRQGRRGFCAASFLIPSLQGNVPPAALVQACPAGARKGGKR